MIKGLSTAAALGCLFGLAIAPALADEVTVDISKITNEGVGAKIGTVKAYDSDNGLVLSIAIKTLPVGPHGFHVHENGSCTRPRRTARWSPASPPVGITIQPAPASIWVRAAKAISATCR